MSQQHDTKTLLEQKATIEKALSIPGIDDFERTTYQDTLRKINAKLEGKSQPATRQSPSPQPRSQSQPAPQQPTVARRVPFATVTASPHQDPLAVKADALFNYQSVVRIDWADSDEPTFLTEGQVRSRFVTCMSDILESSLWRQQRYDSVSKYMAFQRGQVYYEALTKCWGRAPSLSDLDLNSARYSKIFNMII